MSDGVFQWLQQLTNMERIGLQMVAFVYEWYKFWDFLEKRMIKIWEFLENERNKFWGECFFDYFRIENKKHYGQGPDFQKKDLWATAQVEANQ